MLPFLSHIQNTLFNCVQLNCLVLTRLLPPQTERWPSQCPDWPTWMEKSLSGTCKQRCTADEDTLYFRRRYNVYKRLNVKVSLVLISVRVVKVIKGFSSFAGPPPCSSFKCVIKAHSPIRSVVNNLNHLPITLMIQCLSSEHPTQRLSTHGEDRSKN